MVKPSIFAVLAQVNRWMISKAAKRGELRLEDGLIDEGSELSRSYLAQLAEPRVIHGQSAGAWDDESSSKASLRAEGGKKKKPRRTQGRPQGRAPATFGHPEDRGDVELRKVHAAAEKLELANARTRGELLDVGEVRRTFGQQIGAWTAL